MLLYQSRYDVGRYNSLEHIIEESKDSCYETLEADCPGVSRTVRSSYATVRGGVPWSGGDSTRERLKKSVDIVAD
jgi:hypothetical protein